MKIGDQIIAGFEPLTEESISHYRGTLALRYAWEMKDASGIPIQIVIDNMQADALTSANEGDKLFVIFKDYSAMMIDGNNKPQVGFADERLQRRCDGSR